MLTVMVVLIPIVIGRIAAGDPPTSSEPPSEPAPAQQESDTEAPPNDPPVKPPIAPTVQPLPPPPVFLPPPTCVDDVSFYADVSLWYGLTDLHADEGSGHTDAGVFRNAAGFGQHACRNQTPGVGFRAGLVLDIASPDIGDTALGGEVAVDWPVSPSWRLGFRTSVTRGSTTQYWIGARAQAGSLSFGLDVVNSANHAYSNGPVATEISTHAVLAGFGVSGKPGKYVLAAEAITTAIVVGLVIVACTSGGCFGD
jgi:hypothetical protein